MGGGSGSPELAAGSGGSSVSLPAANGCNRELLSLTLDAYFTALEAHDPSRLPLAGGAKFTENGETQDIGKSGLWATAGALRYQHSALDTEACTAVSQAVVPDAGTDIPLALRLKLEANEITEIETIAVRAGDFMLASNTTALSASAMTVHWEDPVPEDRQNTREQLSAWIIKYFRMFPRGVCNTTDDCKRIENGGGSFDCSAGASCAANEPGPNDNALQPRLILADVETGIGVGFTMFQSNTDMHMFKMYGDKVYGVSAILAKADSSGWD